jgi:hypothetical protein
MLQGARQVLFEIGQYMHTGSIDFSAASWLTALLRTSKERRLMFGTLGGLRFASTTRAPSPCSFGEPVKKLGSSTRRSKHAYRR